MKVSEFHCEVYRFPFLICTDCKKSEAYKYYCERANIDQKKISDILIDDWVDGCFISKEGSKTGCFYFVDMENLGTIVHEIFHATMTVLQQSGVAPPEEHNDEHYAYYIQWLFGKIRDAKFKDI